MNTDIYLKQLQEANIHKVGPVGSWMVKMAGRLNIRKAKCRRMKDPAEKKECNRKLNLFYAEMRLANAQKMLANCKDDACRKRMEKNIENAKTALAKLK